MSAERYARERPSGDQATRDAESAALAASGVETSSRSVPSACINQMAPSGLALAKDAPTLVVGALVAEATSATGALPAEAVAGVGFARAARSQATIVTAAATASITAAR